MARTTGRNKGVSRGAAGGAPKHSSKSKKQKHTRGPAPLVALPPKLPSSSGLVKGKGKEKERARAGAFDSDEDDEGDDDLSGGSGQSQDDDDEEEDDQGAGVEDMLDLASSGEEDGSGGHSDSSSEAGSSKQVVRSVRTTSKEDQQRLAFLQNLDVEGMRRSRAEEARLKKLAKKEEKEERKANARVESRARAESPGSDEDSSVYDEEDFTKFDEDEEEDDGFDSDVYEYDSEAPSDSSSIQEARYLERAGKKAKRKAKDELHVKESERAGRKGRLPVRRVDGEWISGESEEENEVQAAKPNGVNGAMTGTSRAVHEDQLSSSSEDEEPPPQPAVGRPSGLDPTIRLTTTTRFGLRAPFEVLSQPSKRARVQEAREQIARISQNIISEDPEEGAALGMLRRLLVFAARKIIRPDHLGGSGDAANGRIKKGSKRRGGEGEDAQEQDETEGVVSVEVDDNIRAAALLSLVAIFVDILPGYRIRPLTELEKSEKVTQEVARRRDFEQGLVVVYRDYLAVCDKLVRAASLRESGNALPGIALKCMAHLVERLPHFNFRTNLISSLISRLSRSTWDQESDLCSKTLVALLKGDLEGEISLEIVRILNRMIKERRFSVHSGVLDILLHLRLREELGNVRASTSVSEGGTRKRKKGPDETEQERRLRYKTGKGKVSAADVRKGKGVHLSKKMVKKTREIREIEQEIREAEAEVDKEEREKNQTETLKLLFVLYFSVLKSPSVPPALLGSALEGLIRFAHRINVDFFRDIVNALRKLVEEAREAADLVGDIYSGSVDVLDAQPQQNGSDSAQGGPASTGGNLAIQVGTKAHRGLREALICLVTAFELLSGQGEALNIDLADLISHLYAILLPLSMDCNIEEIPQLSAYEARQRALESSSHSGNGKSAGGTTTSKTKGGATIPLSSKADLLLRALELCLLRPRASSIPSERSAAFAKRLLTVSLHLPSRTALRIVKLVHALVRRDARLEALLERDDRIVDGRFDAEGEDVDTARPVANGEVGWELELVRLQHVNEDVRKAAEELVRWKR